MPDPETVSFRDTEKAYGGKAAYEKVKAAGRTKLDYRQWVRVRTPEFKTWFGNPSPTDNPSPQSEETNLDSRHQGNDGVYEDH